METPDANDLSPLLPVLQNGSLKQRREAIHVIESRGAEAEIAFPALVKLLGDANLTIRTETAEALVQIGPSAVAALTAGLAVNDADSRKAILIVLARIGPEASTAIPSVEPFLEDDWLGRWAAEAIVSMQWQANQPSPLGWEHWHTSLVIQLALVLGSLLALIVGLYIWLISTRLVPVAALTAGLIMGGVSASMAPLLGYKSWGARRMIAMTTVFGLGGGMAGLLLAWVLVSLIEPIIRVLGR